MNTQFDLPDILTPAETAKVLHIGRTTMYRLLKEKQMKSFQIGRKILIPKKFLQEFIANSAKLCYNTDSQMVGNLSRCEKGETT